MVRHAASPGQRQFMMRLVIWYWTQIQAGQFTWVKRRFLIGSNHWAARQVALTYIAAATAIEAVENEAE